MSCGWPLSQAHDDAVKVVSSARFVLAWQDDAFTLHSTNKVQSGMSRRLAVVACALFFTLAAAAQQSELVLLPVAIEATTQGAFGSKWRTSLSIVNTGTTFGSVDGIRTCFFIACVPDALDPGTTLHALPYPVEQDSPGHLLLVKSPADGEIKVQLRVQDVSRQELT